MKNARNIRYAIVTLDGFIIDPDTGGMRLYPTAEIAMGDMKPGNQIVPIMDEDQKADYESGKLRIPSVNKFGRASHQRMPGQPR